MFAQNGDMLVAFVWGVGRIFEDTPYDAGSVLTLPLASSASAFVICLSPRPDEWTLHRVYLAPFVLLVS